jgi:quercetin dioxygenase-like cupin family protein
VLLDTCLSPRGDWRRAGEHGRATGKGAIGIAGLEIRKFEAADEVRPFVEEKGSVSIVNLASGPVGRGVFEPGWRWSQHVKPIAGTGSCQTAHLGYVLSGRMHVVMDDGSEGECGPGDVVSIGPGHDAWIVGDEPCVFVDFGQIGSYAKPH